MAFLAGVVLLQPVGAAFGNVALMAGQSARPLNGRFNLVPVLHSNQPEEVEGPGILINSAPGAAASAESGQVLRNAEYTFNGEFGMHIHHKYHLSIGGNRGRRAELTLATILINPGLRPVHLRFSMGAVRNSFEAPYLANNLMGVKPLGPRPWNTGPGDATAVQMLRGRLDNRLTDEILIPGRSRVVLFRTELPAQGIANALLRGKSDGPFQMAVVAASNPRSDDDILAVLDGGQLAPGRVYLPRVAEILNRRIFSRVGGVAIGDTYQAALQHDLSLQGALHVPLTSTSRTTFGTAEVQVNPLAARMLDSSLDNVGTYGVRFTIDLRLRGQGPYELVMSHPSPNGGRHFTAFRGSIQIRTDQGLQEVHVGLRSGQSLSLANLDLRPGVVNNVRVSMVYPADATPGHLLSVVPSSQLASLQDRERQLELARRSAPAPLAPLPPPGVEAGPAAPPAPPVFTPVPIQSRPRPPASVWRIPPPAPPEPPGAAPRPGASQGGNSLIDRYRSAVEAQRQMMQGWQSP